MAIFSFHRFPASCLVWLASSSSVCPGPGLAAEDPLAMAVESARKTRDETLLNTLKAQLEKGAPPDTPEAVRFLDLARVNAFLADVSEMRRDKRGAAAAVDKAIEAAERSTELDDKSADAHSLLADLYGRKISFGVAMLAGPKFGPKVKEENAKAMGLDEENPRVWASLGRQYLMAPKMFGGDLPKAVESFQKSLAIDNSQDETWVWLAKAFQRLGDKSRAHDAVQHALSLNPDSPWIKQAATSLD